MAAATDPSSPRPLRQRGRFRWCRSTRSSQAIIIAASLSPPPAVRGLPYRCHRLIGTSSAPCNGGAYYPGGADGEVSHGQGGDDLSQPLLESGSHTDLPQHRPSSTAAAASVFVNGNYNGLAALVLLAALLWPCGAGLPYALLATATLGMWAYGRRGGGDAAAAGTGGSGAGSGGGSGGSHPVLRLLLLQLYCCTHLMLQYMYQVGP